MVKTWPELLLTDWNVHCVVDQWPGIFRVFKLVEHGCHRPVDARFQKMYHGHFLQKYGVALTNI